MTRDVLTRAERRQQRVRFMQNKQEQMTPSEARALMKKTINECLDARSCVTADDLRRANVPEGAIISFGIVLREVLAERSLPVVGYAE